ncbi:uncharacterized protein LOC131648919 [Vicia villosa]|uniref:uncharacterized protein LOC131648919 n=1 Tax=Vicia villosa TaxID=3911 RepID=UPI00273B897E|nr:uncharacterized protein LOC131648919 [Vicia villosa]
MTVTEYAAKFTELAKFYLHYDGEGVEFSKCIKFENGLRSKIKKAIGYQKIRVFLELVDSCRISEEDNNAHYKIVSDRRGKQHQQRGKPYDALTGKGKQRAAPGQRTSGGDAPANIVCFKCGKAGHKSNVCNVEIKKCFRCGKTGHAMSNCKRKEMKPKKAQAEKCLLWMVLRQAMRTDLSEKPKKAQAGGKVFALDGTQTGNEDRLIRGTCFINSTSLVTIFDTGATHYFSAANCVERLSLVLSFMNGEMVVDLPAKGSVTISLVCLKCPLSIFDKDFVVDLICLSLSGLDVILGMNWLEHNYVYINCYNKSGGFLTAKEEEAGLISPR